MVDLLRNKDESFDGTVPTFKYDQIRKKGKHGKYSMGVHSGKYST